MSEHPGSVIVTGAAGGIGATLSEALAAQSWPVIAVDAVPLDEWAVDSSVFSRQVDVADESQVAALFDEARAAGPIWGLVHCAGVTQRVRLADTTIATFDHLVAVNLRGTFLCLRGIAQVLTEQGSGGSIVVIGSINDKLPLPSQAVYSATKAAMASLVDSLAVDLGPQGVRVNTVAPGAVRTPLNPPGSEDEPYRRSVPLRRIGRTSDLIGVTGFLLGEDSAYITGTSVVVDGGFSKQRAGTVDQPAEIFDAPSF